MALSWPDSFYTSSELPSLMSPKKHQNIKPPTGVTDIGPIAEPVEGPPTIPREQEPVVGPPTIPREQEPVNTHLRGQERRLKT
jgi:hypothetical protein